MSARAIIAAVAGSLLVSACASGGSGNRLRERDEDLLLRADPSKVIAAELAFARLAQEKGQWTAFAETSTGDAVMFVPQPVNARAWLRQQTNPAQAVRWQPHQVWSSCDGSLAVTKGAWQRPNGTVGYFTTVWERQRDGDYEWVMDQGDELEQALVAPEFVEAKVAQCDRSDGPPPRRDRYRPAVLRPLSCQGANCTGGGTSADGTLGFAYSVTSAGRQVTVQMRDAGAMSEVMRSEVSAQ